MAGSKKIKANIKGPSVEKMAPQSYKPMPRSYKSVMTNKKKTKSKQMAYK